MVYTFVFVKKKIIEYESTIVLLREEVAQMRNENHQLREQLRQSQEQLRQSQEQIKQLLEQIQQFKNQQNSKTSHVPSSKALVKPIANLRESSEKKPGGQEGRKGITLQKSLSPDEIIEYKPSTCLACGMKLSEEGMRQDYSRQVFDIPPIPKVRCTEHRIFKNQCTCGHMNATTCPSEVSAPVQYGINITAMVSYLHSFQYLPYKRLCEAMEVCFGVNLSEGSIENLLKKSEELLTPTYNRIHDLLIESPVVGGDETGMSINGKKTWMFGFQTPKLTYIVPSWTRGFEIIAELFPNGFPNSIYVSDCYAAQLKIVAKHHQICTAHLMRELKGFILGFQETEYAPKLYELFCKALELNKQEWICPEKRTLLEKEMDELLYNTPIPEKDKIQTFVKRLQKYRKYLFIFLYYQYVPPDNNGTERAIRNIKVKTKVSGFFKSFEGAKRFAVIRSVIDTIKKNPLELFDTFRLIHTTNSYSFSI